MDQRERSADYTAALRVALEGWQRGIWTALPAVVVSYDAADNTITAQPTIRAVIAQQSGGATTTANVDLPPLVKVPVVFPGGGGFRLTFPIVEGDEVLVVFASRCIDAWWQSGGVQNQIEFRAHDLSDGIAIPGLLSVPNVPGGISTDSVQLRSDDGECYVEMAAGHIVNIVAPGGLHVTGPISSTGEITAGQGGADQVGLQSHLGHLATGGVPPQPGT